MGGTKNNFFTELKRIANYELWIMAKIKHSVREQLTTLFLILHAANGKKATPNPSLLVILLSFFQI